MNRALEVMEKGIRRQEKVIRNILNLSRLEAGVKTYISDEIRLDELIRGALDDYRHSLDFLGFEISEDLEEVVIQTDGDMLWHVFSNLVNNVVKYRRREGTPTLEVVLKKEGQEVVARLSDNGVGMSPEEIGRAFERFYQSSPSKEGLGIGLTISRMILEGLGGHINIESTGKGEGTMVTVSLPVGG